MVALRQEQIYVAELRVASRYFLSGEIRDPIPNPQGWDINRGYFKLFHQDEQSDAKGNGGLVLVIELLAPTLKEAEERALNVGKIFASLTSAYGGFPLAAAKLHRTACTGVDGSLKSQHNYWYLENTYMLSTFPPTVRRQFQRYLEIFSSMDGDSKYRLQLAIHWYGISITADDPTVSLVAAWTGLESIGVALDRVFHPNGPKERCNMCNNAPGKGRDRKMAGIDHAFKCVTKNSLPESISKSTRELIVGDLIDGFSAEKANKIRDLAVHSLEDLERLVQKCSGVRRHLIHVLNWSIMHTMGQSAEASVYGRYELHPDGRDSIKIPPRTQKIALLRRLGGGI